MDIYDLSGYKEEDHELVTVVQGLDDDEGIEFSLTDENDEPLYENGELVVIPIDKKELVDLLEILQNSELTFNQLFVNAMQEGIRQAEEDFSNESNENEDED